MVGREFTLLRSLEFSLFRFGRFSHSPCLRSIVYCLAATVVDASTTIVVATAAARAL